MTMKKKTCPNSCSSSSSSCIITPVAEINHGDIEKNKSRKPKRARAKKINGVAKKKNSATSPPKSRSSIYRGVTRHRWTGRFEAHLWDKTTWNQNKRGKQIYLGAYDNEEDAARTYDLAAIKYWGTATILNFPVESYSKEIEELENLTKEEYLASLRRRSNGFSRGVSKYRGVARHHHNGRWEARIGRVSGNKYLYLGTYSTQEEAATAYDVAAIEFRGLNAVTNFDISNYTDKLKKIIPDSELKQQVHVNDQETNPKPFEKEESCDHDQHQQEDIRSCSRIEMMGNNIDSQSMIVMDPTKEHDFEHNYENTDIWDLCLEYSSFNSLSLPDVPLDSAPSEVLSWFDDSFQDDIEYMFDGSFCDEYLLDIDALSGTSDSKVDGDVSLSQNLKGQDSSISPSSSSLSSTMTSIL